MAATSPKSSKEVGKHSQARPKATSKPRGGSSDARRDERAYRASILLKHICDPTRLEIILILARGEHDVGTLGAHLSQSQPAVSHHVALLRHGGIIVPRRDGTKNRYRLTDTGYALSAVVLKLVDEAAPKRTVVLSRPPRTKRPSMESPRQAREESTDLPATPDTQSAGRDAAGEESWSRMNRRRADLIFKKNRGRLNDAERSELERLQALSRSRMQSEFPGPTLIDEELRRIEELLRSDGVDKA